MRILNVTRTLDPRLGGAVEAVKQVCDALEAHGAQAEAVAIASRPDATATDADMPVHHVVPGSSRGYGYSRQLVPWLRAHASDYDACIVHGIWEYPALATWRALRGTPTPYLVFAHGMLDPWFRQAFPIKHLKKSVYWPFATYRVLRDAGAVLFTAEDELRRASHSFWPYRVRSELVGFGITDPDSDPRGHVETFLSAFPALRDKRILLFLGRLHPKKGCDLLIEAFADVGPDHPDVALVFAGPDSEGWRSELLRLARSRGVQDRIVWIDMLEAELKWGALAAASALVLPSHQENFGIVVAEALASGTPVLIARGVNIWREVSESGAGLVCDDDGPSVRAQLDEWLSLDRATHAEFRARARRSYETRFRIEATGRRILDVVADITGTPAPQPAPVSVGR